MRESGRHHSASSGEGGSSWVILNSAEESEDSMKNTICRITGMLALALLAATQTVRAQEPVLVNIPFGFTAGKMALPAGEYRVQATHASPALLIQRTDGRAATFVNSNAVAANEPQTQTKLIFHRYGNRYFLAQVWKAGESRGRELLKSAQEKEQAVARNEAPDQVTIVARLISPKP
jgi:hypothetical protein